MIWCWYAVVCYRNVINRHLSVSNIPYGVATIGVYWWTERMMIVIRVTVCRVNCLWIGAKVASKCLPMHSWKVKSQNTTECRLVTISQKWYGVDTLWCVTETSKTDIYPHVIFRMVLLQSVFTGELKEWWSWLEWPEWHKVDKLTVRAVGRLSYNSWHSCFM